MLTPTSQSASRQLFRPRTVLSSPACTRSPSPTEALAWVERGLLLDKKKPYESSAGDDLAKLKRELLARLGRQDVALAEAWAEFQKTPSKYRYEELMRFVPEAEVAAWHAKALDAAEHGSLGSLIDLLVETKEMGRLIRRLQEASDSALEGLSHFVTEPAADLLAERASRGGRQALPGNGHAHPKCEEEQVLP